MLRRVTDKKNKLSMAILGRLCHFLVATKFSNRCVIGSHLIPKSGPFLLVANHSSRWDPLVIYDLIGRCANYMTLPNELKGLQGVVLRSVGAFPASSKFELTEFVTTQAAKGEGIVIFPEGNIYRDGHLHPFKKGAAHMLIACEQLGIRMPVVSVAIEYESDGIRIVVSPPLTLSTAQIGSDHQRRETVKTVTDELQARLTEYKRAC